MVRGSKGTSLAAAVVAMGAMVCPASAGAAVITPNTTADEYDNVTPNATCSLREAVESMDGGADLGGCMATGAYNSNDTIQLPPGEYKLTIPPGADESGTGDLDFIHDLDVNALAGGPVEIDGNGTDRIFHFSTSLTLSGVTLTGGFVDSPAAGTSTSGGAIFSSGGSSLTVSNSTVNGNRADGFGGGIAANGPTTLTNVTISGNTTTELGGGGIQMGGSTLALDHVTVTGNMSTHDNAAQQITAGGIYTQATSTTFHNSVIAGNVSANTTTPAPDCQANPNPITSNGGNVVGSTTGCTLNSVASDALNMPAMLGPLAHNGGTTQTHALMVGSPAIDRGVVACQGLDQRGLSRANGVSCDAGSFELQVDRDGDGLLDPADSCPTQGGPASNGGCPLPPATPPTIFTPGPANGLASLGGDSVQLQKNNVPLQIACQGGGPACAGSANLSTSGPVVLAAIAAKRKKKIVQLGGASFSIPAGQRQTVRVPLSKQGRKLFKERAKVRANAAVTSAGTTTSSLLIKRPKRKKK